MVCAIGVSTFSLGAQAIDSQAPAATDKKESVEQADESLLDSVTNTIGDAMGDALGLLSIEGRTEGEEGIPRTIAVLPAVGQGDERERDDIRTVIHNNLSSKNFELLKPFDIDHKLTELEQIEGKVHTDYDPLVLAEKLGVEGLIFVDVPLVEKIYAAAYAHYKITIRLSFFSTKHNNFIWEKEETIAEREGGVSLNPLSFIVQAISSAQVLTEAVRQTLVDKLARKFAAAIPFPLGQRAKIKPVIIQLALSNVAEGPFRAGDEVTVFMRGEPGLSATFDIGNKFIGHVFNEQGEGEYVGRYVINDKDNADGLIIKINATRIKDRASIQWRVPGRIIIDTIVPQATSNLVSSPVKNAIKLSWSTQFSSHETLTYHIQRADPQSGLYEDVAAINIQEYVDKTIVEGNNYHYRLYAEDEAGNKSPFTNIQVAAVGVGPTRVVDDIITNTKFHAVASPYIIDKTVRVLRNATLTLSPGTIIKFEGQGKLQVLGKIQGLGDKTSTIAFKGQAWRMMLSNTGENQSVFNYTNFENGSISVDQSSLAINNSQLKDMKTAITVRNNGKLTINNSELLQNELGLLVEDGNLMLDAVRFVNNQLAWEVTGRQEFLATNLRFDDNDVHIDSEKPMLVKNAIFSDLDYTELLDKLAGDVKVDFSNVADKHNLQKQWLKQRWVSVLNSAKDGAWQKAFASLQPLKEHAGDDARLASFDQALRFKLGKSVGRSDPFTLSMQRFAKNNDSGRLWIQEVRLPYAKSTIDSDGYIKKQGAKKLTKDFLKANYPSLKPAQLRKYRRKIKIEQNLVDSQVLYATKKGLFLNVWLANYIDMSKVNRDLILAGLVKKQNSELTVGLLSQTEVFEFEELIVKALKKQGINYISLGTGAYGKPAQRKAQKMGANIVLETAVVVDESSSGISKNLKMVDVNLVLDVYDVQTNKTLDHLTASANAAGFKKRVIVNKAVIESYATIESSLLSALWSADDVVTEHKKQRIKADKAAKAKAAKKRKAKVAADKKRQVKLAKKQAAKKKAEQKRLAKEQAAKDKAEQELIAKEQAAKVKAEQERIANEKVAAKAKAQSDNVKLAVESKVKEEPPSQNSPLQSASIVDVEPAL
jgi:hypothetical protein